MITLKHIAREFELDPYALRQHFRNAGLSPQINRRWKWPDESDPHYIEAHALAKKIASKRSGKSSS